jgi:hypothetical protein
MNPFRRWFGQNPPADSPPTTTLPPGHEFKACAVPLYVDPSVHHLAGGSCLIFLGHGSDEPLEELEGLLRQIEPWIAAPRRPVLLAKEAGPISQLFAPSNPALTSAPRFLIWVFTQAGLEDWQARPAHLQALLRRIHQLEHPTQPFTQCAYFEHDCGPGAAVMARLLAGLGLLVCVATPNPERLLLAEVHRPEGTVITKLLGGIFPLEGPADTVLTTLYKQKAQAKAQGNTTRLRYLEQMERDHLCRELQPLHSEQPRNSALRAPRLWRLMRAAAEQGGPTAWQELERELLERKRPLSVIMRPDGRVSLERIPGAGPVLQVYPDELSMQTVMKERGLAEGSYASGQVPVRDFFAFGAAQNVSVAINLPLAPYKSTHVRWSPAEARLLAQGQSPAAARPLTIIGRKSMSLELTAEEQQTANIADAMMRTLRLMHGHQPYPGLPEGAVPLSELESGACSGKMFIIKRALRTGVDPNEETVSYGTALHAAAQAGQLDVARLLVDHGATPTVRDHQGKTPAELARLQEHWDVAAFLDSVGA